MMAHGAVWAKTVERTVRRSHHSRIPTPSTSRSKQRAGSRGGGHRGSRLPPPIAAVIPLFVLHGNIHFDFNGSVLSRGNRGDS